MTRPQHRYHQTPPTQDLPGYVYPAAHTPVEQPALPHRYRQNSVGRLWQTQQFIHRFHQRLLGIQQRRRNGFILWRHQQTGLIQCLTVTLLALTDAVVRKRAGKKSNTAATLCNQMLCSQITAWVLSGFTQGRPGAQRSTSTNGSFICCSKPSNSGSKIRHRSAHQAGAAAPAHSLHRLDQWRESSAQYHGHDSYLLCPAAVESKTAMPG